MNRGTRSAGDVPAGLLVSGEENDDTPPHLQPSRRMYKASTDNGAVTFPATDLKPVRLRARHDRGVWHEIAPVTE